MTTGCCGARLLGLSAILMVLWTVAGVPPAMADLFERLQTDEAATEPGATTESAPAGAEASVATGTPLFAAEDLVDALPRQWHGTFAWDDGVAYFVEAEIINVSVRPNGEISFTANTIWLPDGLNARMSGRIDPATLNVRIWEVAEDESAESFESDGRYDGAFAADLWDLRARWETEGTGETGDLVLVADSQPSPPE